MMIKELLKKIKNKLKSQHTLNIDENTKCLMIAPHADDEIIGCGGILCKYAGNFDCICIGSSGLAYQNITAKERSDIRIKEFNNVMDRLGIENRWIFETWGIAPFISKIKKYFNDYRKVLNFKKYDYIFMPSPIDNHSEHKFITNKLIKKLIIKNGFKISTKVVFYEVWTPISNPNYFEDITDFMDKKLEILSLYKSQLVKIDYCKRVKGLNLYRGVFKDNVEYSEAYRIINILQYLF